MGKKTIKVHLFFVFVIQYTFSTPYKNKTPDNQVIIRGFRTQTRGRTGMEVNPLVFETSASTDSAIWAHT